VAELRSRVAASLRERGEGGKRCGEAGALDPPFVGPRGEVEAAMGGCPPVGGRGSA
jgi:hypothetical protein